MGIDLNPFSPSPSAWVIIVLTLLLSGSVWKNVDQFKEVTRLEDSAKNLQTAATACSDGVESVQANEIRMKAFIAQAVSKAAESAKAHDRNAQDLLSQSVTGTPEEICLKAKQLGDSYLSNVRGAK